VSRPTVIERIQAMVDKPSRVAIGLMSGTSVDGIDAVLVRINGVGSATRVETLAAQTYPFRPDTREKIFHVFTGSTSDVCQMNFELGRLFGVAACQIARQAGIEMEAVDFVASHGQTIYHVPHGQEMTPSTLQIGEASVIAELTGCVTVSDFRTRDVAAGGDGAPLVPYFDYLLFQEEGIHRVMVNIGGICNLTRLDSDLDRVIAFDTGPGNALIDEIARHLSSEQPYDVDGKLAAQGQVDETLLEELMEHAYFHKSPPKSTGRELFGAGFAHNLLRRVPPERHLDLLATVTALTAQSLQHSLARFILPWSPIDELVFSGGGVHNPTLMAMIQDRCHAFKIRTTDGFGIAVDDKEAIAFAVLGNETLHGRPGNVPRATGASKQVVLGKLSLP